MNTIAINLEDYNEYEIVNVNKTICNKMFFPQKEEIYVKTTKGNRKISKLFINGYVDTIKVKFSDGYEDEISLQHRLRDENMNWKYANTFKVGDTFKTEYGDVVELVALENTKNFTVDFEIEDIHEYISPNGLINHNSIGYIADMTTGGIEPVFALTYARKIEKLDKQYEVVYITDPIFEDYLNNNFDAKTKEKILAQVAENKGSCQKVQEIPEKDRAVFVVASDLTPMEHLTSLGTVARNTSLSVSKTINLPADATREEISEVYLKAHSEGVIGVTVYRDGCREGVLVHKVDENKQEIIVKNNAPKRPKTLPTHVYRVNIFNKVNNESEKWIIFVGLLNDEPYEIIAGKINGHDFDSSITEGELVKTKLDGKKVYQFVKDGQVLCEDVCGTYLNELREYATRLMSLALRHGASVEHLQTVLKKSGTIVDFNQAIVRAISKYVKEVNSKERCPSCNSELRYVEGCVKCSNPECSFSKCG